MSTTRIVIPLGIAVTAAVGLAGCSAGATPSADASETLTIGVTSDPASFDPAQSQQNGVMQFYVPVYDTLVHREPDGELSPWLATSWTLSDDLLSLTLQLRDDVTFSDGTAFDASVVQANIEHFQSAGGPESATLAGVESVETPDEYTAVINLSAPDPALPIALSASAGFMASAEALDAGTLTTEPAGSGPYLLDSAASTAGAQWVYERNENYWGEKLPYDDVILRVYADSNAQLNALRSGQINATVFFSATDGQAAADAGFNYVPNEANYQGLVIFDRAGTQVPALGDVRVRQAINLALDRESLLKTFGLGAGAVTDQIWGPGTAGYQEDLDSHYGFDVETARQLMADAGYAEGFDVRMPTMSAYFDPALMASIAQQLGEIGINVEVYETPVGDFFTGLATGAFPLVYTNYSLLSDWPVAQQFITSSGSSNPMHATDSEMEEMVTQLQYATTEEETAAAAQALNARVVEEAWFAPFFRTETQLFTDDRTVAVPQIEQFAPFIYNYSPAN